MTSTTNAFVLLYFIAHVHATFNWNWVTVPLPPACGSTNGPAFPDIPPEQVATDDNIYQLPASTYVCLDTSTSYSVYPDSTPYWGYTCFSHVDCALQSSYAETYNMYACYNNQCINPCWGLTDNQRKCIGLCASHTECAKYAYNSLQSNYNGASVCSQAAGFQLVFGGQVGGYCTDVCFLETNQCNEDNGETCYTAVGMSPYEMILDNLIICEINECATANGGCDVVTSTCMNQIGESRGNYASYTCLCNAGYTAHPSISNLCIDVDECSLQTYDCPANISTCYNVPGTYWCNCATGYTSDETHKLCNDVNECNAEVYPCGAGTTCVNTAGSYYCEDVNECISSPPVCAQGNTCNNTYGSYQCICRYRYSGTLCQNKYADPTTASIKQQVWLFWNDTRDCLRDAFYYGDANATEWAVISSRNVTRPQVLECCVNATKSRTLCNVFLYVYVNITFAGDPFYGTPLTRFLNHTTVITQAYYIAYNNITYRNASLVYDPFIETYGLNVDPLANVSVTYQRFRFNRACCSTKPMLCAANGGSVATGAESTVAPKWLFITHNVNGAGTLITSGSTWREEEDIQVTNNSLLYSLTNPFLYNRNDYVLEFDSIRPTIQQSSDITCAPFTSIGLTYNSFIASMKTNDNFALAFTYVATSILNSRQLSAKSATSSSLRIMRLPYAITSLLTVLIPYFSYTPQYIDATTGVNTVPRQQLANFHLDTIVNYLNRSTNSYVVYNKPSNSSSVIVRFSFQMQMFMASFDIFRYTLVSDLTRIISNFTNEPIDRFAFLEYTWSDYNQRVPMNRSDRFRVWYEIRSQDRFGRYYNTSIYQVNATLSGLVLNMASPLVQYKPTSLTVGHFNHSDPSEFYTEYIAAVPFDYCDTLPCLNGGTCVNGASSGYTCICTQWFAGTTCQWTNLCLFSNCSVEGTQRCTVTSEVTYNCTCKNGYTDEYCMTNIDECASAPCLHDGTCVDGVAQYACNCSTSSGYSGTHCEINLDMCFSSPCQNSGNCTGNTNSYTCACSECYFGTHCEQERNECLSNPCRHEGVCHDALCGYTCECSSSYTGDRCQYSVTAPPDDEYVSSSSSSSSSTGIRNGNDGNGDNGFSNSAESLLKMENVILLSILCAITTWTLIITLF